MKCQNSVKVNGLKMHRRVCRIKASEKTEVKYMQAWEEKIAGKTKRKKKRIAQKNES